MYSWQLSRAIFLILTLAAVAALWSILPLLVRNINETVAKTIRTTYESVPAQVLIISGISGFFLWQYWPAITFTFFGDDFWYLGLLSEGPLRVFLPFKETHHYYPLFLLAAGIPHWVHLNEAATYHFMNIALHIANGILVYILAFRIMGKKTIACGSAFLFIFYFLNYEPVLWTLGGFPYTLSSFLGLISFLQFLSYREEGRRRHLWGFAVFYVFAIYVNEVTAPLIAVCFCYDLATYKKSEPAVLRRLFSASRDYALPVIALIFQVSIKHLYTHSIVISHNNPHKLMQNFIATCCFLGPFNNMTSFWLFSRWGQNNVLLAVLSVAAILAVVFLLVKTENKFRMMLGWMILFSGPVIVMGQPSPRYYYLVSIGWSIFWAASMDAAAIAFVERLPLLRLSQKIEHKKVLALFAVTLLYGGIAVQGVCHHLYLFDMWRTGSAIISTSVNSTAELIRNHPEKKKIIVVDQPTWLKGNDFYGVLLLINEMGVPLNILTGLSGINVRSVHLEDDTSYDIFPKLSQADIESAVLDIDTLVIRYDKRDFHAYEHHSVQ